MGKSLDQEIAVQAERVRRTDFLWGAGLASGACFILAYATDVRAVFAISVWAVIMLGLAARFFMANVNWSAPVQKAIKNELTLFQRLRAVVNALPDPVIVLKKDGLVELANPAANELMGIGPEGEFLTTVFRAPMVSMALEDAIKSGNSQKADFVLAAPIERHCRVYVTPLSSLQGDEVDPSLMEGRHLVFISDLTTERRLEKMRSDFIANASHELRTPLASMLGFLETLQGHAKDDPEAREKFLGIMQAQAERMLRLVKDLMSLSSIELNEHLLPDDKIDLVAIADEVRTSLEPVAVSYGGTLEVKNQLEERQQVEGDRDQLVQVIQNLADNALKYAGEAPDVEIIIGRGTPPQHGDVRTGETAVQISARAGIAVSDLVYVQVRDHGAGIRRKDLPRLTERFYRVDVEASRTRGGTGLGLAIVKHILNRHRGGLQIESVEGEGSAFTCFFRPV